MKGNKYATKCQTVKNIDTTDDDDVDPISNNQIIRDEFDVLLQKNPRNYTSSPTGVWFFHMKEQLSERYMHTLLRIVYDIVRVLSKSQYTLASELIDGVNKRVEYEVSMYQQKYDGDVVSDVIVDHDTLNIDTSDVLCKGTGLPKRTANDDLNNTIISNIKAFLTPLRSGATTTITSSTKNTIISACTYRYKLDQDRIKKSNGVSKNFFYENSSRREGVDASAFKVKSRKKRISNHGNIMRQCVHSFCNYDDSSSIDSSSRKMS